jgi:hypothetical protein
MEITVSDGEAKRFPAGSIVVVEDTTGQGHTRQAISDGNVLLVAVELAE